MLQIELYIIRNIFILFCHRQNVKENIPHTHKLQIDVSRGKLTMDASPYIIPDFLYIMLKYERTSKGNL